MYQSHTVAIYKRPGYRDQLCIISQDFPNYEPNRIYVFDKDIKNQAVLLKDNPVLLKTLSYSIPYLNDVVTMAPIFSLRPRLFPNGEVSKRYNINGKFNSLIFKAFEDLFRLWDLFDSIEDRESVIMSYLDRTYRLPKLAYRPIGQQCLSDSIREAYVIAQNSKNFDNNVCLTIVEMLRRHYVK